ncbi:MAG: nucleotidyltransferase substrate binding protein [Caldisericia bacterium]
MKLEYYSLDKLKKEIKEIIGKHLVFKIENFKKSIIKLEEDHIKNAFQVKLIDYNNDFLKMIEDRNLTTHIYDENIADDVYSRLPTYLNLFKKLLEKIEKIFLIFTSLLLYMVHQEISEHQFFFLMFH